MMLSRRLLTLGLSMLALLPGVARAQSPAPAGRISRLKGSVVVFRKGARDGASAVLNIPLYRGDRVQTGKDSRVELTFSDGGVVTLGDGSVLTVEAYLFEPDTSDGGMILDLSKGVFRMVSGGIGTLQGAPLAVTTPVATIGIRGTDFWGDVAADKLFLALLDGKGVFAQNAAGTFDLDTPGTAFLITDQAGTASEPQVLTPDQLQAAVATISF